MLNSNLQAHHLVYYAARWRNGTQASEHIFVIDGIDDEGRYSVNFGTGNSFISPMHHDGRYAPYALPEKFIIFGFSFTFRCKTNRHNQLGEVKVTNLPSLTFTFTRRSKTSCFTS